MADHDHDPADPILGDEAWLQHHLRGGSHPGRDGHHPVNLDLAGLIASHEFEHPELKAVTEAREQAIRELLRELADAQEDLAWLAGHGALPGVAEIIGERRRQIEQKGYTAVHDDAESVADPGHLMYRTLKQAEETVHGAEEYSNGPAEVERDLARTGALAAAEIDRLNREFTPEEASGAG